jgi:hypothetical protein
VAVRLNWRSSSTTRGFEGPDFIEHEPERVAHQIGQRAGRLVDDLRRAGHDDACTHGNRQSLFAQQPAKDIDASRPRRLPLRAHPMEGLERLLLDGLDGNRLNTATAVGLKEHFGVGAVRLAPTNVGAHTARVTTGPAPAPDSVAPNNAPCHSPP